LLLYPQENLASTVDDNVVVEDLHFNLFHPQSQRSVPILILGCDSECNGGAQDQRTAALEVKGVAIESQVVPIARDDAGGISADMAVVEAVLLQAVLIILAGDILAVDAVVGKGNSSSTLLTTSSSHPLCSTILTSQPCATMSRPTPPLPISKGS
uniref:Uncharacterized protein n=1 Tax=Melopsittacus undulatus TaxID=13146 RepID=A0A8C6JEZ2_MELUD